MANTNTPAVPQDESNPMLLALVAQFLKNHGFSSTFRILNTERRKRPKKEGWQTAVTDELPPLETIFRAWRQGHTEQGTKSNESDDGTTGSSSDSDSEEDESIASDNSAEESSGSSQQSNSSDEETNQEVSIKPSKKGTKTEEKPISILDPMKSLKRKAQDSSSESSESASDGDSSEGNDSDSAIDNDSKEKPTAKRQRLESPSSESSSDSESDLESNSELGSDSDSESQSDSESSSKPGSTLNGTLSAQVLSQKALNRAASSSDTSSDGEPSDDSSESDSSSDEKDHVALGANSTHDNAQSDSSGTVVGDKSSARPPLDTSSGEEVVAVVERVVTKKKHIGARPSKLAALSADADMDDYISNTYVSYDYADKAFRDLSVTRGKGFTKEKNKKKRGSYRGGAIDISGGKAFKFDD